METLLGADGVEDCGPRLADGVTLLTEPEGDRRRVDQVAGVLAPHCRHSCCVNPDVRTIETSAKTGAGIDEVCAWMSALAQHE